MQFFDGNIVEVKRSSRIRQKFHHQIGEITGYHTFNWYYVRMFDSDRSELILNGSEIQSVRPLTVR